MRKFTMLLLGILAIATPIQSQSADTTSWKDVIPPTTKAKLIKWLNKKNYQQNFIAEPSIHPTNSPHGINVRTYYNPILALDLYADKTVFRKGAAMVKEIYMEDTNTVTGYAVMVKVQQHDNAQGEDWLFYETSDTKGKNALIGKNAPACTGCHQSGVDYLRSDFRP